VNGLGDAAENGGFHRRRRLEVHERQEFVPLLGHAHLNRRRRRAVAQILRQFGKAEAAFAQIIDNDRQRFGRVNTASVDMEDQNVAGLCQRPGTAHEPVAALER
jgi:hypothetical protein